MADGKWIAGLTPGMPVEDAARVVMAARLEVVRQFLPLAAEKPYDDPEYVHQLRVGTRRAGAAVRVFADCLPKKHLKATRRSLRAIRRAAGDARDWDVFLDSLTAAKALVVAAGKPAHDFLLGYALGERSAAQVSLVRAATDAGPGFVEESIALPARMHAPHGGNPPATFADLAATHLGELLARFNTAIEANPTDPPALHQLRILGKQVRYALEIFADCFPPEVKDAVYPAVEDVQTILGDIQDAVVGVDRLAGLRDRVKQVTPAEWPRLRKGIEGLMKSQRAKIPAGKKAFQRWRKRWAGLVAAVKLDTLRAAAMA